LLGGLLIGSIVNRPLPGDLDGRPAAAPGTNAKKMIEDGLLRREGLRRPTAAAITGDTVGDPYKDTAGPAIKPDDQDRQHRRDPHHPRSSSPFTGKGESRETWFRRRRNQVPFASGTWFWRSRNQVRDFRPDCHNRLIAPRRLS